MKKPHSCTTDWGWCKVSIELTDSAELEEVMAQVRHTLLGAGYDEDDLEGYIHI